MAVNQRQFDQLSEMGINLWQRKAVDCLGNTPKQINTKQPDCYVAQDEQSLSELTRKTIFTDILLSCNISIGEITTKNDHLDLGLFNWYFSSQKENDLVIRCEHNNLFSPNLLLVSQSPKLKKQLWLTISNHLL